MFGWLIGFLRKSNVEEAFTRFMLPHVERARSAGLSEELIDKLVKEAIVESDGVLRYPGALLRDKVDYHIEQSDTD